MKLPNMLNKEKMKFGFIILAITSTNVILYASQPAASQKQIHPAIVYHIEKKEKSFVCQAWHQDVKKIGSIEYCPDNACYDKRPSILSLEIDSNFQKQGLASQLISRSLAHIKELRGAKQCDVHLLAFPIMTQFDIAKKDYKKKTTIDQLILFYQNRGAELVVKQTISAQMKFPKEFIWSEPNKENASKV